MLWVFVGILLGGQLAYSCNVIMSAEAMGEAIPWQMHLHWPRLVFRVLSGKLISPVERAHVQVMASDFARRHSQRPGLPELPPGSECIAVEPLYRALWIRDAQFRVEHETKAEDLVELWATPAGTLELRTARYVEALEPTDLEGVDFEVSP